MTLAKSSEKHISACILVSPPFHLSNVVVSKLTHSRGLAARWLHDCQPCNKGDYYTRTQVVWLKPDVYRSQVSKVSSSWQWWRSESQRRPFRIRRNLHRIGNVFRQYRWFFMHWTTPSPRQRRACSSLLKNASWIQIHSRAGGRYQNFHQKGTQRSTCPIIHFWSFWYSSSSCYATILPSERFLTFLFPVHCEWQEDRNRC